MSRTRRVLTGATTAGLVLGAFAGLGPAASADPVNAHSSTASVSCSDGSTYVVTVPDQSAQFASAHDLGSTATLIPLAWGLAHIELHSIDDGSLLAAFDEDWGGTKGRSARQPGATECTVSIAGPEDIPDLGAVFVTVDIPVTLVVTPR